MQKKLCCMVGNTKNNAKLFVDMYDEWLHWPDWNIATPHVFMCHTHLMCAAEAVQKRNQKYMDQQKVDLMFDNVDMKDIMSYQEGEK